MRPAPASLLLLLASAALGLAACGGDDDAGSPPTSGPAPPGTTAPAGTAGPTGEGSPRDRSTTSRGSGGRIRPDRPPRGEELAGIDRGIYQMARARCRTLPLDVAARRYRSKSADPKDVARAFAREMYPPPRLQRSAYLGCLDGLPDR